jgi:uncharacterized protein (DUF1697 family)
MSVKQKDVRKKAKSAGRRIRGSWYVALLRGVNIGTSKRVPMSELRSIVEDLGYANVQTLLNSGNVVFTANIKSPEEAAAAIEKALVDRLKISSRVTVVTADEIAKIIKDNPMDKTADNPSKLLISVLTNPADVAKLKPLVKQDWGEEMLVIKGRVAYQWCPNGTLAGELAPAVAKALGHGVTARNSATMSKLHAMMTDPE